MIVRSDHPCFFSRRIDCLVWGHKDSTSNQNDLLWFICTVWASSWIIIYSAISWGIKDNLRLSDIFFWAEQLPHLVRWSLIVTRLYGSQCLLLSSFNWLVSCCLAWRRFWVYCSLVHQGKEEEWWLFFLIDLL